MAEPDESKSVELTLEENAFIADTRKWMRETLGENVLAHVENDWIYVVTLHAMIETALNDALIKHFQAPELARVIARLDTSNTATGKVAFAKALKILQPETAVFAQNFRS